MAGYRLPGPLCVEQQLWSLLDGTSALWRTPPPGPVCVASSLYKASAPRPVRVADLSFLFRQCLNPMTGIGDDDYKKAAITFGVDVATIKAVAEVETFGNAFDAFGRPRILRP